MKIVIIDNYDSFTYNLSHLVKELGAEVTVVRNDQFRLEELEQYSKIILSPGPGIPSEAGLLLDVIRTYAGRKPILGVCLGHQAICEAFGGTISHASRLMHGKSSKISLDYDFIFKELPSEISVGRYHSLSLVKDTLPDCLEIISKAKDDGEIMAVKHKDFNVYGLQFHPESILTPDGLTIIRNFIEKVNRGIL